MKTGVFLVLVLASTQAFPQKFDHDYFARPYRKKCENGLGIIGGLYASPHQFPYQVGIFPYSNTTSQGICGGSLISPNYVLTAAHCLDDVSETELVFGAHNITDVGETSQIRINSTEFIVHEKWNIKKMVNDIALIKLRTPIEENDVIKIVPIANGSDSYAGSEGIVSGWGNTADGQIVITDTLKYITTPIISNAECSDFSQSFANILDPTKMCTSGSGHVSTCGGDSGGPLVVDGVQVGVVSFGYMFCEQGYPSVYTRLTEFKSWIAQNSDVAFLDV